jgi:sugar phosphate isomerase/epimerase
MKLGISSYTFYWAIAHREPKTDRTLKAMDLLQKAAALGVGLVQIADNLPLVKLDPGERKTLLGRARELGIEIELGMRGLVHKNVQAHLELADEFGCRLLRAVVDAPGHTPSLDEVLGTIRDFLPELEKRGVVLAIENHESYKAREFMYIMEKIDSPSVGICLDTVNSLGTLEDLERVTALLGPYTVNLHVKDFRVRRMSHQLGFIVEGAPAGEGMLPIPRLLEKLKKWGRDPNAVLELWTVPEEQNRNTIAKEELWAEKSIKYLRSLIPN